jgi:sigma-B regulation protein RsbU (phosphoserine phosphatase)
VLVFTDGVTEARDKNWDFYEKSRLEAYLAASASQTAEELVTGLLAAVERFEAGTPRADDVTVLVLRRLPASFNGRGGQ